MKRFIPVALLLLSAACTQEMAEIQYKGDEFYGKVHEVALDNPQHETFPQNSPRIKEGYARPVDEAKVQSVGVSDLAPPSATSAPAQNTNVAALPKPKSDSRFIWPVADGKIISHFGPKAGGGSNDGVNVAVAEGEPIWAAAGGTVVYAGSDLKGYGNMVIVRHDNGWMTAYAHARSIAVKKGDVVKQGDIIAYVGMSGGAKSPQLHFAIRNGRTPVDPELYLPKTMASR